MSLFSKEDIADKNSTEISRFNTHEKTEEAFLTHFEELENITVSNNTIIYWQSNGNWDMHDLLAFFLKFGTAKIYITTSAISEIAMRKLHSYLKEDKVSELHMVVDYRNTSRKPAELAFLEKFACSLALEKVHAKITIIELPAITVTIVGSANYTRNPRLEAGSISFSPTVADFYKQTIISIIDEHKRRTNKGD